MPSCAANGADEVFACLLRARNEAGRTADVFVTQTLCLGPCPRQGVTVVVYPEGVWYTGVDMRAAEEIARRHMLGGEIVDTLRDRDWG